jgi:hypothetical protein
MKIQLSKDRMIQIALAAVVAILVIVVIIMAVNKKHEPDLSFVLNGQEEDAVTDETAQPVDESNKTDTTAKTTTTKTATTTTPATTTTSAPTGSGCKPGLSGKKSDMPKGIVLSWTACTNDDFQFYKLVKSATNATPSYPGDSVVMSSSNTRISNYVDKTVAPNTTYYYRVCVVQRLSKNSCGNAISVKY